MIVSRPRVGRDHLAFPAPTSGIQRVDMMKILGVTLTYIPSHLTLISTSYLGRLPSHCMRSEYFVRTVSLGKPSGTSHAQPHCPKCYMHHPHGGDMLIWATCRQRLQNFIFKLQRLGFLPNNTPSFEELCGSADDVLFGSMLTNEYHVLAQLLPPVKETPYHLRPRAHNRSLPATDNIMRKNFNVMRMLYKDSFWFTSSYYLF